MAEYFSAFYKEIKMNHIQEAIVKTIPQLSGCYCGSNDTLFDMAYEMADYHLHEVIDTMERLGGPETSIRSRSRRGYGLGRA